jgi:hypothetical protein
MNAHGILIYLFLTAILGGGAATMMGRNFAANWRSIAQVVLAGIGLAIGVRFLHFALFQQPLLTLPGFLLDAMVVIFFGLLGHRWRRTEQMTSQYYWLYERTGPLSWRKKPYPQKKPRDLARKRMTVP